MIKPHFLLEPVSVPLLESPSVTSLQSLVFHVQEVLQDPFLENEQKKHAIHPLFKNFHESEVAKLLEYLGYHERLYLVQILGPLLDPLVLAFLDDTVQSEVLSVISDARLAHIVSCLESDDAFQVIQNLEASRQTNVLTHISKTQRERFEAVLTYPEQSAGRMMQSEMVTLPNVLTVGQALRHLAAQTSLPDTFHNIFITDPKHHLLGVVPVSKLLCASHEKPLGGLMNKAINTISVTLDQEEVALIFRQYSLISAPVVDEAGHVVGIITVDDVVHVIDEEAQEDIMHLARTESDFYASVFRTTFSRFRWLVVTLVNTLLASSVISQFQGALEKKVALAVLMPIVAAMGGNAGMQVVTITVRAIATRQLGPINMFRALFKELSVALLNGLLFACILGSVSFLWFHDTDLSLVLGVAVAMNVLWAGFGGTILPLVLEKMRLDPALSAGPLLTTTTDILGFAFFLGLSTYLLVS